jgi:hypothetical protein
VNNFFIVFVYHLNEPGPPMVYRGDGGNVVVYSARPEAEAAAAELTAATSKNPNFSFTVTEFQPL